MEKYGEQLNLDKQVVHLGYEDPVELLQRRQEEERRKAASRQQRDDDNVMDEDNDGDMAWMLPPSAKNAAVARN